MCLNSVHLRKPTLEGFFCVKIYYRKKLFISKPCVTNIYQLQFHDIQLSGDLQGPSQNKCTFISGIYTGNYNFSQFEAKFYRLVISRYQNASNFATSMWNIAKIDLYKTIFQKVIENKFEDSIFLWKTFKDLHFLLFLLCQ